MFTQFIESGDEEIEIVSAVKLSQNEFCRPVNGKIISSDLLLTLFKSITLRIRTQCVGTFMVRGSLPR